MKNLIALEELAQFILVVAGLYLQPLHPAWWLWPLLFLAPDLSMAGYLAGPKAGARLYNLVHHKAVAAACIVLGWKLALPSLLLAGLVLYGHSSLDRALGYGLKYADDFGHTHLGPIGKKAGR